eukprot:scaffold195574_cov26-Tisochrysis_lutea.AAC.3
MRNWRPGWRRKVSKRRTSEAVWKLESMFLSNSSIARSGVAESCHMARMSESVENACSPPDSERSEEVARPVGSLPFGHTSTASVSLAWSNVRVPPSVRYERWRRKSSTACRPYSLIARLWNFCRSRSAAPTPSAVARTAATLSVCAAKAASASRKAPTSAAYVVLPALAPPAAFSALRSAARKRSSRFLSSSIVGGTAAPTGCVASSLASDASPPLGKSASTRARTLAAAAWRASRSTSACRMAAAARSAACRFLCTALVAARSRSSSPLMSSRPVPPRPPPRARTSASAERSSRSAFVSLASAMLTAAWRSAVSRVRRKTSPSISRRSARSAPSRSSRSSASAARATVARLRSAALAHAIALARSRPAASSARRAASASRPTC